MTKYTVKDRLGLNDLVCQRCNARVPQGSPACRKCGGTEFRERNPIDKYD